MKTKIVKIGNSQGVRIPKLLLEESGLKGAVELKVKKDEIRIVPILSKKRIRLNPEYLASLPVLRRDWDNPEEDKAWASLQ